jgi:hypothetical protein
VATAAVGVDDAGMLPDEVACDESGWEGANLSTGRSDVIAYASVRLTAEAAADCLRQLGGRAGPAPREFKASHVLRPVRRSTVTSLLGPAGPLHGKAFVHLTDKAYFVVGRALDLVLGQSAEAASAGLAADPRLTDLAAKLTRDRRPAFLAACNAVVRIEKPWQVREPVDAFIDLVEELRPVRSVAYAARAQLLEDRVLHPAGEPLIPALARTVLHWSRGGTTDVAIVHDEQSALTERRIRWLERQLLPPGRELRFRQVDSRTDRRVQVADVLAGLARRLAADALHGRGDAELCRLLRPFVDPGSRWCDEPSWSTMARPAGSRAAAC